MKTRREILLALGGGLAAAPLGALAQKRGPVWRIGILASRRGPGSFEWENFYNQVPRRLSELGYVEGKDLVFEWRYAAGDYTRLPGFAAEFAKLNVDLIVTDGSQGIRAAQGATKMIPIVFVGGSDVVASGFVKSLSRPGGNTTGVSLLLNDSIGKQVEILTHIVPKLSRLAILENPFNKDVTPQLRRLIQNATAPFRIEVLAVEAQNPQEIEDAFSRAVRERADALLWFVGSFLQQQQSQIAELAAKHRLPAITGVIEYAEVGGLMGYGPDRRALWRRVADYVDKILKGAKPAELPVQQPTKFELVLNLKTAKALGLAIPQALLLRADEVIR